MNGLFVHSVLSRRNDCISKQTANATACLDAGPASEGNVKHRGWKLWDLETCRGPLMEQRLLCPFSQTACVVVFIIKKKKITREKAISLYCFLSMPFLLEVRDETSKPGTSSSWAPSSRVINRWHTSHCSRHFSLCFLLPLWRNRKH